MRFFYFQFFPAVSLKLSAQFSSNFASNFRIDTLFSPEIAALIVQWLGHLVVAEKTWVRFPLGAHNNVVDSIDGAIRLHFLKIAVVCGMKSVVYDHLTTSWSLACATINWCCLILAPFEKHIFQMRRDLHYRLNWYHPTESKMLLCQSLVRHLLKQPKIKQVYSLQPISYVASVQKKLSSIC